MNCMLLKFANVPELRKIGGTNDRHIGTKNTRPRFERSTGFRQTSWQRSAAAQEPVPSLAEAIAGEPIRGSWWGRSKGRQIFRTLQAVCGNRDVLVCKLVDG